jgi:hypothetical protein
MLKLQTPAIIAGSLPNNYAEVLFWKVTENRTRVWLAQALALVSFVVFGVIFFELAIVVGQLPALGLFSIGLAECGAVLIGVILTLVLHELTHGLAMQVFGATPTYGVLWKGLMLYATSPGYAYPRSAYLVIILAPFVGITVLALLGMWALQGTVWVPLLALCGAVNASGAIGDLWMLTIVLRYAPHAYVMDERDGMRVFLPKPL